MMMGGVARAKDNCFTSSAWLGWFRTIILSGRFELCWICPGPMGSRRPTTPRSAVLRKAVRGAAMLPCPRCLTTLQRGLEPVRSMPRQHAEQRNKKRYGSASPRATGHPTVATDYALKVFRDDRHSGCGQVPAPNMECPVQVVTNSRLKIESQRRGRRVGISAAIPADSGFHRINREGLEQASRSDSVFGVTPRRLGFAIGRLLAEFSVFRGQRGGYLVCRRRLSRGAG
jgi:hypothetical protein